MNVDDYRKAYAAQMAKDSPGATDSSGPRAVAGSPAGDHAPAEHGDWIAQQIATFGNLSLPAEVRLDALRDIQTATFSGPSFAPYRASYRDALRKVAAEDKNEELRTGALEYLAFGKDDFARQLLLRGLENTAQALVSTAKAIQLLAHDDHGVAIPIARRVVNGDYDVGAKAEALRVLASDPQSDGLLASILSDRSQAQPLRSISAAALRILNPQRFVQVAQKIAVDQHEDDKVRANTLGALSHMAGFSTKANQDFRDQLAKLDLSGKGDDLRKAAARFLQINASR
jgi:hypothetical protein